MEEFTDKTIQCIDCGEEFTFTAGEQAFYKEKGLNNEPKRCRECRNKKKEMINSRKEHFNQEQNEE